MPDLSLGTKKLLDTSLIAWENQDVERALDVLDKLKDNSATEGLSKTWLQELEARMKWIAFPALIEEEQLELIANNLLIPLRSESFDLEKVFTLKQLATSTTNWLKSIPRMLNAILKNEELLGSQPIPLGDNPKAKPTVGNWVKGYVKMYGMDKRNEMAVRKYLADLTSAQSLSLPDRKILEELLLLFESIKIFSVKQITDEVKKIDEREKRADQKAKNALSQQQVAQQQVPAQKNTPLPQTPQQTVTQQWTPQHQAPRQELAPKQQISPQSQPLQQQVPQQQPALRQVSQQQPFPQQETPRQPVAQTVLPTIPTSTPQKPEIQNINSLQQLRPVPLKQSAGSTIQKTIKQAFQTNPQVADQSVTSTPISLLGREEKVIPTVQNWLFDYRSQFGATGNTEDERQEFLFKSPNTRNLSTEERRRLSAVIESHDKDTPLTISKDKGIILFN